MPANLLNLPAYRVIEIETNDHDDHIDAETVTSSSVCPHCQSDRLVGFGRRKQMVKDLPIHGKRVGTQQQKQQNSILTTSPARN